METLTTKPIAKSTHIENNPIGLDAGVVAEIRQPLNTLLSSMMVMYHQ